MSDNALGGYLAFVLFIGAAFNDAFEWQRAAMRRALGVHMERIKTGSREEGKAAMRDVLLDVQKIMGKNWVPDSESLGQIEVLLKGE